MISAQGLIQLGFTPEADFVLQDNGNGPEIRDWNSNKPQPSESEIVAGQTAWDVEQVAKQAVTAETKSSAIGKLKSLGLNDAEIAIIIGG